MKRKVHAAKGNLDWTVRLVWVPTAIRPVGPRQILEGSATPGQRRSGAGVLVIPFSLLVFLIFVVPVMAIVLPLRYARVLAWRVEATAYPWGRKSEALVMRWKAKGRKDELQRVVDEIAAALERGDNNPQIAGAVRERG